MSLTVEATKSYDGQVEAVYKAALDAVAGLEGKVSKQDLARHRFEVWFDKKILGRVLGDRTQLNVQVSDAGGGKTAVAVEAVPLDAVNRPLKFGARKGVAETVVNWFYAHLEHRLGGTSNAA